MVVERKLTVYLLCYLLSFIFFFLSRSAIQEAMRAVVGPSPTNHQQQQYDQQQQYEQQRLQQHRQFAYHQKMKELAMQQHQQQQQQQRYKQKQRRSPRSSSSSSVSRSRSPRTNGTQQQRYVALAPGRDAVLKYQERQYRRQHNDQMRQYTGHAEVIQQQQQQHDVNLAGNRMKLGSRIRNARSWENGRRPHYHNN